MCVFLQHYFNQFNCFNSLFTEFRLDLSQLLALSEQSPRGGDDTIVVGVDSGHATPLLTGNFMSWGPGLPMMSVNNTKSESIKSTIVGRGGTVYSIGILLRVSILGVSCGYDARVCEQRVCARAQRYSTYILLVLSRGLSVNGYDHFRVYHNVNPFSSIFTLLFKYEQF